MDEPTKKKATPLYLAPGAKSLVELSNQEIPKGCVRVVCISDTHNEQDGIDLPWGHLLG